MVLQEEHWTASSSSAPSSCLWVDRWCPADSYIQALSPSVIVLGDGALGVIRVRCSQVAGGP